MDRQQTVLGGRLPLASAVAAAAADGLPTDVPPVVALDLDTALFFRRLLRLYYIATATGGLSSGVAADVADACVTVGVSSDAAASSAVPAVAGPRLGALSALASVAFVPLFTPALMAVWGKTAYAPIHCRRRTVLFPTRRHLAAYEAAVAFTQETELAWAVPSSGGTRHAASKAAAGAAPLPATPVYAPGRRVSDPDDLPVGTDLKRMLPSLLLAADGAASAGVGSLATMAQLVVATGALPPDFSQDAAEAVPEPVATALRASFCFAAASAMYDVQPRGAGDGGDGSNGDGDAAAGAHAAVLQPCTTCSRARGFWTSLTPRTVLAASCGRAWTPWSAIGCTRKQWRCSGSC